MIANPQTLPAILKAWCGDRSVRQAALALGVADNTLHSWLAGESFPPRTRIATFAPILGLSTEDLAKLVAKARIARRRRLHALERKATTAPGAGR